MLKNHAPPTSPTDEVVEWTRHRTTWKETRSRRSQTDAKPTPNSSKRDLGFRRVGAARLLHGCIAAFRQRPQNHSIWQTHMLNTCHALVARANIGVLGVEPCDRHTTLCQVQGLLHRSKTEGVAETPKVTPTVLPTNGHQKPSPAPPMLIKRKRKFENRTRRKSNALENPTQTRLPVITFSGPTPSRRQLHVHIARHSTRQRKTLAFGQSRARLRPHVFRKPLCGGRWCCACSLLRWKLKWIQGDLSPAPSRWVTQLVCMFIVQFVFRSFWALVCCAGRPHTAVHTFMFQ